MSLQPGRRLCSSQRSLSLCTPLPLPPRNPPPSSTLSPPPIPHPPPSLPLSSPAPEAHMSCGWASWARARSARRARAWRLGVCPHNPRLDPQPRHAKMAWARGLRTAMRVAHRAPREGSIGPSRSPNFARRAPRCASRDYLRALGPPLWRRRAARLSSRPSSRDYLRALGPPSSRDYLRALGPPSGRDYLRALGPLGDR